jgi:hypothetical protein
VLELGLEEAHYLHCRSCSPRDRDRRHVVGRVDLLDRAVGDLEALGGAPVPGDHDSVNVPEGQDGRALGSVNGAGGLCGKEVGGVGLEELGEGRAGAVDGRAQEVPGAVTHFHERQDIR